MHKCVYERFDLTEAFEYDSWRRYRPETLRNHIDFAEYYKVGAPFPAAPLDGATAIVAS